MKKIYYSILIIFFCHNYQSTAQSTKDLFSIPGLTFVVDVYDDVGVFGDGSLYYIGDTILNDTTYLIYENKRRYLSYFYIDGHKVYSKSITSDYQELLFDFGMEEGDTMIIYFDYEYIVDSKETIQLGDGLDRIQLNMSRPGYPFWDVTIIEGMGYEKHGMILYYNSSITLQCLTSDTSDIYFHEDYTMEECDSRSCLGIEASFGVTGEKENIQLSYDCYNFDSISLTFGDGIIHNEFIDSYTFEETGCYQIELEIFNECGESAYRTSYYNNCENPKWQKQSDLTLRDIHFLNSNIGFGSKSGGVYKTEDGGSNWTELNLPETEEGYHIKSVHFASPSYGIISSTAEEQNLAIMITEDGGLTWQGVFEENPSFVNAIIDDDGTLFAMTVRGGLYRSYDKGLVWTKLDLPFSWSHKDFQVVGDGVLIMANLKFDFPGLLSYLFISNDNGDTWKEIDMTFDERINSVYFFDENHGFVGMESDVYETFDKGNTWHKRFSLKEKGYFQNLNFFNEQDGIVSFFGRYYLTNDGGQNWVLDNCNSANYIHDIALIENQYYSCNKNGFYKKMPNPDFDCDEILSTQEGDLSTIQIVPNPSSDQIQLIAEGSKDYQVEIRTIAGQLVVSKTLNHLDFVNISDLKSGLHLVTIRNGNFYKTTKLVKI